MSGILRKLNFFRNLLVRRKPEPNEITEEKWIADFSKQKHARFDIKSESSYDANLRKNLFYSGHSLVLGLKKTGAIAWIDAPAHRYRDLIISGTIRIDAGGGYGAGGMLFRMVDEGTYYSFLVSNKGYFRLDALRNGMPLPLIGWTELPLSAGAALGPDETVDFSLIAFGSHIVILLRGRWAAEINDSSILEGTISFTAASYESGDPAYKVIREVKNENDTSYTTEVFLESLSVDSRMKEVSSLYEKWRDGANVDSGARLNLAGTFYAMTQHNAAMVQLRKAWDTPGHVKTQAELLLAGRLARALGLMAEAEKYIGQCYEEDLGSSEGKEALTEMAGILNAGERYGELKEFCAEAVKVKPNDPVLWNFKGHAHWNLEEYKIAALAYNRAFELDSKNGIFAKNAANVYDVMGRKKEALESYLESGKAFLKEGNYNDLGLLVPRLLSLGGENWEARSLSGKWAFAVEDWKMAEEEFRRAEELRKAKRPKPHKDGAQVFLEALLLVRTGKRREALPLLEEAVSLEKNYALFRFRLAENIFLLDDDPDNPKMLREMNAALSLSEKESKNEADKESEGQAGWINNFAAQVALRKGNLDAASRYLDRAAKILGDLPAVRVNRGVLFYLRGSLDKALATLDGDRQDDPEGVMANCAGNLLVRSGRFDEADAQYRKALAAADNVEYLCNRSSCLMELGRYGEADELLAKAHTITPSPAILEMISYVAVKKGECARAEQACRSALEMDPNHAPSLLSLGWLILTLGKLEEAREIINRLDALELKEDTAKGLEELRSRLDDLLYSTIACASCSRTWKTPKDPPPAPSIRLFAMPPDNLPAGSCLDCGKTYCIGCAKNNLDLSGRFICPVCGRTLKLVNEGLKMILHDWAVSDGLVKSKKAKAEKPKTEKGRPKKNSGPEKRGRGRPRKIHQVIEKPAVKAAVENEKPIEKATAKDPVERKKPAVPVEKRGRSRKNDRTARAGKRRPGRHGKSDR